MIFYLQEKRINRICIRIFKSLKAIDNIHSKYKDRLDKLSVILKAKTTDREEELWNFIVGQDNQKIIYLWIEVNTARYKHHKSSKKIPEKKYSRWKRYYKLLHFYAQKYPNLSQPI